ncbi:MAG: thiamine-phosphate kinase [Cyanobium sp.]
MSDGEPHDPHSETASSRTGETLAELGEWELINRLAPFAPEGQFADDAALLGSGNDGGTLVVNTDVLVEGIHFSEATTKPADVGWRAAAANLSDLAAMGCTEVVGLTVGLVAPADTRWSWVEEVYQGLTKALRHYGGVLLGGDCSGGSQRLLAVTALGRLPNGRGGPIRRRDGRPGDLLVCTGPHGLSRLGLAVLRGERTGVAPGAQGATPVCHGLDPDAEPAAWTDIAAALPGQALSRILPPELIRRAIHCHRRPVPRFDAVRALDGCRPASALWRIGGCDSSDGLAAAVAAIAAASGCSALLDRNALPIDPAMADLTEALPWCLGGGEDFELVLALEPDWATALLKAQPGAGVIGRLEAGPAGRLGWSDGRDWPEDAGGSTGFRHFG